ncbi:hypothetical protein RLOC_00006534 [Lonchura striata]|uniref:Uncharacterized protein n=1 Tax=Lonchura striata TaxID=40157 RepID=A0A218UZG8_9PASE|nr:hypothetical protein RLOC_00006534 [Lonchura striata domestica]
MRGCRCWSSITVSSSRM